MSFELSDKVCSTRFGHVFVKMTYVYKKGYTFRLGFNLSCWESYLFLFENLFMGN